MRAAKGYGPKPLFFEVIKPHFSKPHNLRRLATAFLGAACEHWLNGEVFQAIVEARPTTVPRLEWAKTDVALFEAGTVTPELILESKVIYSSEPLASQARRLDVLRLQLKDRIKRYPLARVVGLITYFEWTSVSSDGVETRPGRRSKRAAFPSREQRIERGLINDFGHGGKSWLNRSAPVVVQLPNHIYRVWMAMETVRAAPELAK